MRTVTKTFLLCLILFSYQQTNATTKPQQPTFNILNQTGTLHIQFDLNRVVIPNRIVNADNPTTWRAFFPTCPPGSHYVSGVNSHLVELDQPPNFFYCKCICLNQCNGLAGVSSTAGKIPQYTATVTCAADVKGWFDKDLFPQNQKTGFLSTNPHEFYYCQNGNCQTHPFPGTIAYTVPTGGYANTTYVDFQACTIAYKNNFCGSPNYSAIGKRTIY